MNSTVTFARQYKCRQGRFFGRLPSDQVWLPILWPSPFSHWTEEGHVLSQMKKKGNNCSRMCCPWWSIPKCHDLYLDSNRSWITCFWSH